MLMQEGAQLNVVFMDNDILVFKSLARIFETEDFDYGCTISDSPVMPVRFCDPCDSGLAGQHTASGLQRWSTCCLQPCIFTPRH